MSKPLQRALNIDAHLKELLECIKKAQGQAILVGGAVRDHLMMKEAVDFDIEAYGLSYEDLHKCLSKRFVVNEVGKSFGIFVVVVDINGHKKSFDVALPRTENKIAQGHKGFLVKTIPDLSFAEASRRRDFSINAMGIDVERNELLDPHGGQKDLADKVLRHVSDAFKEDPLRVLRAAQFAARFDFVIHESTLELCRSLSNELSSLSCERIFQEMKKLFLADKPSIGLKVLKESHALVLFPELFSLIDCPQDPEWHPEGDVWIHTLMVVDEARALAEKALVSEEEKLVIIVGALCHDLGKPSTTQIIDGRIKSPAHEQAGEAPTRSLLKALGFYKRYEDEVVSLVREHLKPFQLYKKRDEVSDAAIKRLAGRVNIAWLLLVSEADFLGRTSPEALKRIDPSAQWLRNKAQELNVEHAAPAPLLKGRHLLELGLSPGKEMGHVLHEAMEAQLEGEFFDESSAIAWAKEYILKNQYNKKA